MGLRIFAVFGILAVTSVAASMNLVRPPTSFTSPRAALPSLAPSSSVAPTISPVDPLNETIQARFQDIKRLGMARIPKHIRHYSPETSDEKSAVAELRQAGLGMAFYLGGRGLQGPGMSKSEWENTDKYDRRKAVSEPIVVTNDETVKDLPRPWELWGLGREALAATVKADSFTRTFGRWSVDVRPVRANRQACLDCHDSGFAAVPEDSEKTLKIGDPLGVVIYVYARTPG